MDIRIFRGKVLLLTERKNEDTVTLTMIPTARVSVSFQTTPTDAVIVVKNEAGETMTALEENASSYSLPANEKYSYEVSADGHVGKSGYFTADAAKTIKVDLVSAGTAWDGTTTKEPTLTNGVYSNKQCRGTGMVCRKNQQGCRCKCHPDCEHQLE